MILRLIIINYLLITQQDKEVPSISEEPEADIQPPPEKNQQEDDNTAACPERAPPVDNKDDIYTTPEVFKEQDNQAIEVMLGTVWICITVTSQWAR